MIVVERLRKHFGHVEAVRDVTFTARDATVTGLLGPNGAGKTTTLRLLSALLAPDAGSIQVDGTDVVRDPIGARRIMGLLPDSRGLYPRLTPREHIRYFGELHGVAPSVLRERTESLLRALGLDAIADRRVSGFSQGERTKVALARALVHAPRNVVLDEPTNGLDVMAVRNLRVLLRRLRDAGHCVLFSSHVMQEVSALCDVVIVLARGAVVARGTPDELRERTGCASLEDAFVQLIGSDEGLG